MRYSEIGILLFVASPIAAQAQSQSSNRCLALKSAVPAGVEITNSNLAPAGKTTAPATGPPFPGRSRPLSAYPKQAQDTGS